MALSAAEKAKAARYLIRNIFVAPNAEAHSNLNDLIAVIEKIDEAMEMVINDIPGAWGTKTILQAILDFFPEPFQSDSTAQQKAEAFKAWADLKANKIL